MGTIGSNPKLLESYKFFLRKIENEYDLCLENMIGGLSGHLIPSRGMCRGVFKERVLLVGDAGGFVNPLTGGGLKYGVQSGIFAAETIKQYLESKIESLVLYEQRTNKLIQPTFKNALGIQNQLSSASNIDLLDLFHRHPEIKSILYKLFIGDKHEIITD